MLLKVVIEIIFRVARSEGICGLSILFLNWPNANAAIRNASEVPFLHGAEPQPALIACIGLIKSHSGPEMVLIPRNKFLT